MQLIINYVADFADLLGGCLPFLMNASQNPRYGIFLFKVTMKILGKSVKSPQE